MRKLTLFAAAMLAACHRERVVVAASPSSTPAPAQSPARAAAIVSADQLVAAMHDRYSATWYRTLTFVQKSTYLRADGTASRVETWYEAAAIPGRLRIDLGDLAKGNGALYRGDSAYSLQGGQIADRRVSRNPLLILGFDVYLQPAARTLEQLRAERIDVSLLHADTLYGRRVYVVGAGPMDSTSNQFWIDAERLLFLRLIQTDPERKTTRDIRFAKYAPYSGGWVAEEVRVINQGKLVFHEEYANVRVNVPLDDALFVPERWATVSHWYKP